MILDQINVMGKNCVKLKQKPCTIFSADRWALSDNPK
jgi:hypothetical protein